VGEVSGRACGVVLAVETLEREAEESFAEEGVLGSEGADADAAEVVKMRRMGWESDERESLLSEDGMEAVEGSSCAFPISLETVVRV